MSQYIRISMILRDVFLIVAIIEALVIVNLVHEVVDYRNELVQIRTELTGHVVDTEEDSK